MLVSITHLMRMRKLFIELEGIYQLRLQAFYVEAEALPHVLSIIITHFLIHVPK